MKEQLSLLETLLPAGTASAWDALDAEQRARIVLMLARLIARAAVEPAGTADEEKSDE